MIYDVNAWMLSCDKCQAIKVRKTRVRLQIHNVDDPWERKAFIFTIHKQEAWNSRSDFGRQLG